MFADVRHHGGAFVTNAANMVTLGRILASPVIFWMILANEESLGASWGAVILGFILAVSDLIDGRLARSHGVTKAGSFLDPLADKIVVIGSSVALWQVGAYWWLPVVLIIVRELGISAWRSWLATKSVVVPARQAAKWKSTIQGVALLIAVAPPFEQTRWLVTLSLWVAVALTLYTGYLYLRDGSRSYAGAS